MSGAAVVRKLQPQVSLRMPGPTSEKMTAFWRGGAGFVEQGAAGLPSGPALRKLGRPLRATFANRKTNFGPYQEQGL